MAHERISTRSEEYITRLFSKESASLKEISKALRADGKFGINVSPYEGKLLHFFIRLIRAKTVVEIGTLYGYSTVWMAEALPEDGKIVSIEKNPENFERAMTLVKAAPAASKIDLRCGDAVELLRELDLTADLVFIDADKGNYANYLSWAVRHVRPGGLIIGDNTFLFGHMIGEDRGERAGEKAIAAMTAFNETLAKSDEFVSIMIPTFEGMTVAMRKH